MSTLWGNQWSNEDRYEFLQKFGKFAAYYIYGTERDFVIKMQQSFPNKSSSEVRSLIRDLMLRFGVAHATGKDFKVKDVIYVQNGDVKGSEARNQECKEAVHIHEFLYSIICVLPENNKSLWLFDELRRFIHKLKQYRLEITAGKLELLIKKLQIWNKSLTETRVKFDRLYALYQQTQSSRSIDKPCDATIREKTLWDIFSEYHGKQTLVADLAGNEVCPFLPHLKSCDCLSSDMQRSYAKLISFCEKTKNLEAAAMLRQIGVTLDRSDKGVWNKVKMLLEDWEQQSPTANVVDCSYTDLAFKVCKVITEWKELQVPLILSIDIAGDTCSTSYEKVMQSSPEKHTELVCREYQKDTFDEFVRLFSDKIGWTPEITYRICKAMSQHIALYKSNELVQFYDAVHQSCGENMQRLELVLNGNALLRSFTKRYLLIDFLDKLASSVTIAAICSRDQYVVTSLQNGSCLTDPATRQKSEHVSRKSNLPKWKVSPASEEKRSLRNQKSRSSKSRNKKCKTESLSCPAPKRLRQYTDHKIHESSMSEEDFELLSQITLLKDSTKQLLSREHSVSDAPSVCVSAREHQIAEKWRAIIRPMEGTLDER